MNVLLYYFSGTGNTLTVARDIAEGTGGTLVPIAAAIQAESIRPEADAVGIIFPVYYGELPVIIKRFAEKLTDIEGRYLFAVSTFGGSAGYSLRLLKNLIEQRGGTLSATYQVHMPQNSFYKWWEKHDVLYASWRKKRGTVIAYTLRHAKGDFFKHLFLRPMFLLTDYIVKQMKPSYRKAFSKHSTLPPDSDMDTLIQHNDASFRTTAACTGCGLCAKVCPVGNVEMVEGRPSWLHHCENCLACYNWCPHQSITGGIAAAGYYYRHPAVKASDIMQQNGTTTR